MSKSWLPGLALLALPLFPRTAGAQEAPDVLPPTHTPSPARVPAATSPEPALDPEGARRTPQKDPDAVFRAFDIFVKQERATRITGALGGVVAGGMMMGVGGWAADRTRTAQTPWLVGGGVVAGIATLALIIPGPSENVASTMRTGEKGHTESEARALEAEWRKLAENARTERYVGAVFGLVLGAGAVGSGIGVMSGAGDLDRDEKAVVGGILVGTGAGLLTAGAAAFFLRTPAETSFAQFRATQSAAPPLDVSLSAGPGGFSLGARGTF